MHANVTVIFAHRRRAPVSEMIAMLERVCKSLWVEGDVMVKAIIFRCHGELQNPKWRASAWMFGDGGDHQLEGIDK